MRTPSLPGITAPAAPGIETTCRHHDAASLEGHFKQSPIGTVAQER